MRNKSIQVHQLLKLVSKFGNLLLAVLVFSQINIPILCAQENSSLSAIQKSAEALVESEQFIDAAIEYEKILYLQETVLGTDHPEIVSTLTRLGEIYMITGELDKADRNLQRAVSIRYQQVIDSQSDLYTPLKDLINLYALMADNERLEFVSSRLAELMEMNKRWREDSLQYNWTVPPWETKFQFKSLFPDSLGFQRFTRNEEANDLMAIGHSYIEAGLYTDAVESFSQALLLDTESLSVDYYYQFTLPDTIHYDGFYNAMILQKVSREANDAVDFYLALVNMARQDTAAAAFNMLDYVKSQPDDFRGYFILGDLYTSMGEYFDALVNYQKAVSLRPDDIRARFATGRILVKLQEYSDAIQALNIVLTIDPDHPQALFEMGRIYIALEQFEDAIPYLTQALVRNPASAETYYHLGVANYKSNNLPKAIEALQSAINIDPEHLWAHYYLGRINESLLKADIAKNHYEKARRISSAVPEVNYYLGKLLYRQENYKDAMEPLRDYIIEFPDSLNMVKLLADVFIREQRYTEAVDIFTRLKEAEPDQISHYYQIGFAYEQLGDLQNALYTYEELLLFDESNSDILYRLGVICNELGDFQQAALYLQTALDCGNPTMKMHYQLAFAYGGMHKYMQAYLSFKEASKLAPEDLQIQYQMGVALMQMEMYEEAADKLLRYTQVNSKDPIANFLLAKSLFHNGNYQPAITFFNRVLRTNSDDFRSHYYVGKCYFNLGQFEDAAKSLKKALNINPDDAQAHYSLGLTYLELKKFRSAGNELNILYMLDRALFDSLNVRIENKP
ncbi:MAG: tetratricopeptide repeat protein [Fidelibacterota bacterium]